MSLLKRLQDAGRRPELTDDGVLITQRLASGGICIRLETSHLKLERVVPWLTLASTADDFDVLEQVYREALTEIREARNVPSS